jgi:hypothetical protein
MKTLLLGLLFSVAAIAAPNMVSKQLSGTVVSISDKKGTAIIKTVDGKKHTVKIANIEDGKKGKKIQAGAQVTFQKQIEKNR